MRADAELPTVELGHLANFEARMLRSFRAAVEDWEEVCAGLGAWESSQLTKENSDAATAQHLSWIQELISWGEMVRQAVGHPAFPDSDLLARVDDRLRHLQDKLALWHGEMTPSEEERILRTAFP